MGRGIAVSNLSPRSDRRAPPELYPRQPVSSSTAYAWQFEGRPIARAQRETPPSQPHYREFVPGGGLCPGEGCDGVGAAVALGGGAGTNSGSSQHEWTREFNVSVALGSMFPWRTTQRKVVCTCPPGHPKRSYSSRWRNAVSRSSRHKRPTTRSPSHTHSGLAAGPFKDCPASAARSALAFFSCLAASAWLAADLASAEESPLCAGARSERRTKTSAAQDPTAAARKPGKDMFLLRYDNRNG
jgi:hypothetical protein